jgi:hypothetical protein
MHRHLARDSVDEQSVRERGTGRPRCMGPKRRLRLQSTKPKRHPPAIVVGKMEMRSKQDSNQSAKHNWRHNESQKILTSMIGNQFEMCSISIWAELCASAFMHAAAAAAEPLPILLLPAHQNGLLKFGTNGEKVFVLAHTQRFQVHLPGRYFWGNCTFAESKNAS